MQTPGDFWGTLKQDMHNWDDSQVVTKATLLDGYDVFGDAHGDEIEAADPTGGGNHAERLWSGRQGDRVLCRWDMRAGEYYMVLVEPNDFGWQTPNVVTRTTLAIDFDAKTFTHRYYTRQITIPPGVTIGDEVQH